MAAEQPATSPVLYRDGLKVTLSAIRRSVMQGWGPGVIQGAPLLTVDITVTNGTKEKLDLSSVVVSGRYASPELLASGAYTAEAIDFSGTLAPGASAKATYAFMLPAVTKGQTRIVVDIDALHGPAVFRGAFA